MATVYILWKIINKIPFRAEEKNIFESAWKTVSCTRLKITIPNYQNCAANSVLCPQLWSWNILNASSQHPSSQLDTAGITRNIEPWNRSWISISAFPHEEKFLPETRVGVFLCRRCQDSLIMKIKYFKMQVAKDFFNVSIMGNGDRVCDVTPLKIEVFSFRSTIKMTCFQM